MGMFGALGKAIKAPLKPINKAVSAMPGMKSASKAMPGAGALGGALGLGPSPQAQNQMGGLAARMGQAASSFAPQGMKPQTAPPMGDANQLSMGARNPQQPFPGGEADVTAPMGAPDMMGAMPQPMNPSAVDPNAMMAKRKMQMGGGGIGPSFGRGNRMM